MLELLEKGVLVKVGAHPSEGARQASSTAPWNSNRPAKDQIGAHPSEAAKEVPNQQKDSSTTSTRFYGPRIPGLDAALSSVQTSAPTGRRQAYSDAPKKVKIALIELFAGLRTTHVAARLVKEIQIVLSHASEKCPFSNLLALKNNIQELLHTDVARMDSK